jgi:hypothetical protein
MNPSSGLWRSSVSVSVSVALGCVFAGAGCGGSVSVSAERQQNVMVVDEGFDVSVPDLQGKVAAAYTESCVDDSSASDASASLTGDAGAVDAGPIFDMLKQELIAEFKVPDDSCHIRTGIAAKRDPFASIAQYRTRWNAMIRANQGVARAFDASESAQLMAAIDAEFMTFDDHGTSTASTVAHDNPGVRLVLVERELSSESAEQADFTCFAQSDIDQIVDLLSDPQVYSAYVNQPAQIDGELAAVMSRYDVGLVNESFGAEARAALELLQAQSCATPVDLSAYFKILNQGARDHAATIGGPQVLTVQAAGNDGDEIDSGADSLACDIGDPLNLLVGSYDTSQVRSTFSNFGACVDVYAPGESIVAYYAGSWLLPVAGTSFAAPMVARYVSLNAPTPYDPTGARTALLSLRTADGSLPLASFPSDFFYLPEQTAAAAIPRLLSRPGRLRPPSRFDLHRIRAPISRLRALRGS